MFTDRSFLHGVHKSAQLHQRVDNQTMFLYHFAYNGIYSFTQVLTNTTIDFGQHFTYICIERQVEFKVINSRILLFHYLSACFSPV